MLLFFTMVNERGTISLQHREAYICLLLHRGAPGAGIIQSCGQAIDLAVTTGQVIAIDRTTVRTQDEW